MSEEDSDKTKQQYEEGYDQEIEWEFNEIKKNIKNKN